MRVLEYKWLVKDLFMVVVFIFFFWILLMIVVVIIFGMCVFFGVFLILGRVFLIIVIMRVF